MRFPARRENALGAVMATVVVAAVALLPAGAQAASATAAPVADRMPAGAPTDEIEYAAASREEVTTARRAVSAALAAAKRKEEQADLEPGPGGMLPASAGDNGTFDEPPESPVRQLNAVTMSGVDGLPPERSAVLLGRTAIAPPGAPEEVQRAIDAANAIVGRPYIWGGGHARWNDRGYDCSGAVSYALGGAGLLGAPVDSTALMDWGEPGRGKWITVYANAGHTYAVIAGLRWDTVGQQRGTGPKWHAEVPYPEGYVARHPAGL